MFGSSSPEQQLNNIHLLIHQGKLAEAQQRLTQFNKENPRNPVGFFLAALLTEDRAQKIAFCERALNLDPQFGPARELLDMLRRNVQAGYEKFLPAPDYRGQPQSPRTPSSFFSNLSFEAGIAIAVVALGLLVLVIIGLTNFVTSSKPGIVASVPTTSGPRVIYVSSTPTILQPTPSDTPGAPAEYQIQAMTGALHQIDFQVTDAEYSNSLDRIIAISDNPPLLHIYDPETNNDTTVPLSRPGLSVSVSADGNFAAVGQDATVSYIDLQSAAIVKTLNISIKAADIVIEPNGWIYALPPGTSWVTLDAVQLSSNKERTLKENTYGGSRFRRGNDGKSLYVVSPSTSEYIIRYTPNPDGELTKEPAPFKHCEDSWLFPNQQTMHFGCDTVFQSASKAKSIRNFDSAVSTLVQFIGFGYSARAKKLAALVSPSMKGEDYPLQSSQDLSPFVYIYDDFSLARTNIFTLPTFADGTPSGGNFIFTNNEGTRLYVFVQDFNPSYLRYDASGSASNNKSFGIVAAYIDPSFSISRPTPKASPTRVVSTAALPTRVAPILTPTPIKVTPTVDATFAAQSKLVQFDFPVVNAAYSQSLNQLVLISDDPPAVHIYDPTDGSDKTVPLARLPISVTVSRDGKTTAIGQDQRITIVDINTAKLIKNYDMSISVTDLTIANNGWIYAVTQQERVKSIFGLNMNTGDTNTSATIERFNYGHLTLSHDGKKLFFDPQEGVYTGVHHFNVNDDGTLSADLNPDPVGDQIECGKVWVSQDDQRLTNACGITYKPSSDGKNHWAYSGTLDKSTYPNALGMKYYDMAQTNNLLLALPGVDQPGVSVGQTLKAKVLVFNNDTLQIVSTIDMPKFNDGGRLIDNTVGKEIFVNAQGNLFYAIVQSQTYHNTYDLVTFYGLWIAPVPTLH